MSAELAENTRPFTQDELEDQAIRQLMDKKCADAFMEMYGESIYRTRKTQLRDGFISGFYGGAAKGSVMIQDLLRETSEKLKAAKADNLAKDGIIVLMPATSEEQAAKESIEKI